MKHPRVLLGSIAFIGVVVFRRQVAMPRGLTLCVEYVQFVEIYQKYAFFAAIQARTKVGVV